ncbi:SDR family NAD(P)-dependent oxidoreductase [Erythrobacter alti]|uniref:SDR family NAD(P)-dependent oxidoreductase n=1 Tax=Erythrobacter alti TaxID=1896145 RepID=UPI0030F4458E
MQTAVITGASAGIGKASAVALGKQGWRIIGVGRDPQRCEDTQAELEAEGVTIDFLRADFDTMAEVRRVAGEIAKLTDRIDVLVNNAGGVRDKRYATLDGLEATFAANHLAPFLLTRDLLPILRGTAAVTPPGSVRVIAVSSSAHEYMPAMSFADLQFEENFSAGAAYCQAKLANLLFTRELARRHSGDGIIAQAMHPGIIASNFYNYGDASMRSHLEIKGGNPPEHAARTIAWMATSPECGGKPGRYFHDCAEAEAQPQAHDDAAARQLWEASEGILEDLGI